MNYTKNLNSKLGLLILLIALTINVKGTSPFPITEVQTKESESQYANDLNPFNWIFLNSMD